MIKPRFSLLESLSSTASEYDIFVTALGYERRGRFISNYLALIGDKCLAIGFEHGIAHSYVDNKNFFTKQGFCVFENIKKTEFEALLKKEIGNRINDLSPAKELIIGVDVSCFDRYRLASIVAVVNEVSITRPASVYFWYALAAFTPPPVNIPPNEVVGPIHGSFAGWFNDPGRPLALVVGLGYEPGKALGAAEYLQATKVVAFFPDSPVEEFSPEVERSNRLILSQLCPEEIVHYRVDDPEMTLARVHSVVTGLCISHNVVLLPLGPKIFSLVSLLERLIQPEISVWRVSEGSWIQPKDVESSGNVFGLRVCFPIIELQEITSCDLLNS